MRTEMARPGALGDVGRTETPLSDRKRNRLQALERRLSSPPSSLKKTTPTLTSPLSNPSAADSEGPTYAKLTQHIRDGDVAAHLQLSARDNSGRVIDSILRELVQDNKKSVRNIAGVLDSKIQDRVLLLDNPPGHGKAVEKARKRAKASLAKRSRKHLSKRQHKLIGSYALPLRYHRYELFLPMHDLWKNYAKHLLEGNSGKMIEPNLLQLDLHGAILAVVEAKIKNYVGTRGIMIRETLNTFAIVSSDNKVKVVPKAGSVFMFCLDDMLVTLHGDHLSETKG